MLPEIFKSGTKHDQIVDYNFMGIICYELLNNSRFLNSQRKILNIVLRKQ